MQLLIESPQEVWRAGDAVTVRLIALNDSFEAAPVDRRLLVGPNPVTPGLPILSLEPAMPGQESVVLLNPWCFLGRLRTFDRLGPAAVTFHAYLLSEPTDALSPEGPQDPEALAIRATPLVIELR